MINSACRGSTSYSTRSRPAPYRVPWFDPSNNPIQNSDFFDISKFCTETRTDMMFYHEVFGRLFLDLFLWLLPRAQHHKVVTVSEHRNARFSRRVKKRRKDSCHETHRGQDVFTRHTEALCRILRSVHRLVQNCVPTLALNRLRVVPCSRWCDARCCESVLC